MEDAAHLSECFARVAAELNAMLMHEAMVTNGFGAHGEGPQEPAGYSRAALEAYLRERRIERLANSITTQVQDRPAA